MNLDEGIFDDLLQSPRAAPSPEAGAFRRPDVQPPRGPLTGTGSLLALAVARLEPGAKGPFPRPCTCARCESVADKARRAGDARIPPVFEVESWIAPSGIRVFAGLCKTCSDIEWSERWNLLYSAAEKTNSRGEMTRLTTQVQEREMGGRKFHGVWRGVAA